jgi:MFS family permease
MFFFVAFAPVVTFAPQWAGGEQHALLTVTLVYWTALILGPVVGLLMDRHGHARRWLGGGMLIFAAVLTAMALGLASPIPAMIFVGIAAASVPTATYALPGRLAPAAHVGFTFGFITAFSNLGTLIGPAAAGAIRDHSESWSATWLTLAIIALLGAASVAFMSSHSD